MPTTRVSSGEQSYPSAVMVRRPKNNVPRDAVPLYVDPGAYKRLKQSGAWSRREDLVFNVSDMRWWIAPSHPDFQSMVDNYGEANAAAVAAWTAARAADDRVYREFNEAAGGIPSEHRLHLNGLDLDTAHEIGAQYDRTAELWFIDARRDDAAKLARAHNGPAGAELDAARLEKRDGGYMSAAAGLTAAVAAGNLAAAYDPSADPQAEYLEGLRGTLTQLQDATALAGQTGGLAQDGAGAMENAADLVGAGLQEACAAAQAEGMDGGVAPAAQAFAGEAAGFAETAAVYAKAGVENFAAAAATASEMTGGYLAAAGTLTAATAKVALATIPKAALVAVGATAGAAAGVGAYAAYRAWSKRRQARIEMAKTTPWMMEPKAFGSVAGRTVDLQRTPLEGGGERLELKNRETGDVVFAASAKTARTPARNVIRAYHAALVDGAAARGLAPPANVVAALAKETRRMAIEGKVRVDPNVEVLRIDPDEKPARVREIGEDLKRRPTGLLPQMAAKTLTKVAEVNRQLRGQPAERREALAGEAARRRQAYGLGAKMLQAELRRRELSQSRRRPRARGAER